MRKLLIVVALILCGALVTEASENKCKTILVANEHPTTGKLVGYYYHLSHPWGTGDGTCDCESGVYVSYYLGINSTEVTLNAPQSSCTPGSSYVYQTFQSGQNMPPAGAHFTYTHGERNWIATCGVVDTGKVSCDQSGVEYDD